MNADGTDQRQLTSNHLRDSAPNWSPDGTQITFSSFHDLYSLSDQGSAVGGPEADSPGEVGDWEVVVVNADGTHLRQLTYNDHDDWAPSWSPDGAQITFQSNRDGDAEIFVMNADGTIPRQLTGPVFRAS